MPSSSPSIESTTNRQGRTAEQISEIMREVKGRDTAPERELRRALFQRGLRFRVCDERLPGKPDIVFPGPKLVVFIDGDYWHGHQWRLRGLRSLDEQFENVNNPEYWVRKIRRNQQRDFEHTAKLLDEGWRVLRFWENDLKRDVNTLVDCVEAAVNKPGAREDGFAFEALPSRGVSEFFAGIGLVRLGLDGAGWRTVFANDIDPDKASMYAANFGEAGFVLGDVHDLKPNELPASALFTASFPCNDLSVAGAKAGLAGRHSSAFWGVIRLLEELGARKPPLIMFENVTGFLKSHGGRDLETALQALNRLGYACDLLTLNATSFVPQSRPRLFIIAQPSDSTTKDDVEHDTVLNGAGPRSKESLRFIAGRREINWSLRRLPDAPICSSDLTDILEDLADDDPHWWNEKRAMYFFNQMSDRHRVIAEEMVTSPIVSYATAFRRIRNGRSMAELRTDGIAGCLRTPRGGSGRQILFKAGQGRFQVRLLTARECARLQGAPDDFRINTTLNKALFGFGDAVCVPVIQWIAQHYLTPLAAELIRGRVLVSRG